VARVCTDGFSHANISFYATDAAKSNTFTTSTPEIPSGGGGVKSYGEEVGRCEHVPLSLQSVYPEYVMLAVYISNDCECDDCGAGRSRQ
jgi:hypothetical protein